MGCRFPSKCHTVGECFRSAQVLLHGVLLLGAARLHAQHRHINTVAVSVDQTAEQHCTVERKAGFPSVLVKTVRNSKMAFHSSPVHASIADEKLATQVRATEDKLKWHSSSFWSACLLLLLTATNHTRVGTNDALWVRKLQSSCTSVRK